MPVDYLITNADELVTLCKSSDAPLTGRALREFEVIRNGSIAIRGKCIVAVGTSDEVREAISGDAIVEEINASGMTVIPGFVDPHTHAVFAGSREEEFRLRLDGKSYMDISVQGGGIHRTVQDTRQASNEELIALGLSQLERVLATGTTTIEIKSGYGLSLSSELKILDVIECLDRQHPLSVVATFLGAHTYPSEYRDKHDEFISQVVHEMLPEVASRHLAKYCDVFCESGVFTPDESEKILLAARDHGLGLKIHADEMSHSGGTCLAASLKAVSVDHVNFACDEDLEALATAGTIAVLLPATPFFLLAPRYADARKIIAKGVPVALATDYNPTSSISSMPFVIFLACMKMHMHPSEALAAATINAAHAIGRADQVGSLETGKIADVVMLDVASHLDIPFNVGRNIIHTVFKNGRPVYESDGMLASSQP